MATIILQTTAFGSHGGIQAYNRAFSRVLDDLGELGERYVLIGTDHSDDVASVISKGQLTGLRLEEFGGRKAAFVRRALQLAVQKKVELIIAGHVNYAPVAMMVKCLRPSARFGVVIHGQDVWLRLSRLRRMALRRADFVMSVSRDTLKQAARINGEMRGRQYLLPNSLSWEDEERAANHALGIPAGLRLLSVGRLAANEGEKGVDAVIAALPQIAASVADVQYVVVGSGTDLERHRVLATKLGVADRVHFLGSIDESKLRECYRTCDVFVLPSAQEGFGIVYLEAMRYAKPVIAANSGGVPEVVKDGETGSLVEYGNVEQIATAITALARDPALRKALGEAGRARLEKNFTFAHFKQRLREIINAELPGFAVSNDSRKISLAGSSS